MMQIFEVTNQVPAEHFIKMSKRVQMLQSLNSELISAMEEVLRISDRKHDAWDAAKAAIARSKEFGYE